MRVVGGLIKGRRLASFKGREVRPTSDKIREAVFNVLGSITAEEVAAGEVAGGSVEDKRVLDLFAGTGALGIEALSRGALDAVFVEKDPRAVEVIRKNLDTCGLEGVASLLKRDALGALGYLRKKEERFELVFMDAPYAEGELTRETLRRLSSSGVLAPGAIVVCETPARESKTPPDVEEAKEDNGPKHSSLKHNSLKHNSLKHNGLKHNGPTEDIGTVAINAGLEFLKKKVYGDTAVYFLRAAGKRT